MLSLAGSLLHQRLRLGGLAANDLCRDQVGKEGRHQNREQVADKATKSALHVRLVATRLHREFGLRLLFLGFGCAGGCLAGCAGNRCAVANQKVLLVGNRHRVGQAVGLGWNGRWRHGRFIRVDVNLHQTARMVQVEFVANDAAGDQHHAAQDKQAKPGE